MKQEENQTEKRDTTTTIVLIHFFLEAQVGFSLFGKRKCTFPFLGRTFLLLMEVHNVLFLFFRKARGSTWSAFLFFGKLMEAYDVLFPFSGSSTIFLFKKHMLIFSWEHRDFPFLRNTCCVYHFSENIVVLLTEKKLFLQKNITNFFHQNLRKTKQKLKSRKCQKKLRNM